MLLSAPARAFALGHDCKKLFTIKGGLTLDMMLHKTLELSDLPFKSTPCREFTEKIYLGYIVVF
jgi:hypothetical protein